MSDFGVSVDGFTPATAVADQARAAEAGGARTLWIATHLFLRDPVAMAGAALAATSALRVGLMAMSPYSIHPVYAAMAAATLAELYPGRVVLSLGVGAPADLAAAAIDAPRPVGTLRESIAVCRALFAGETSAGGAEFRIEGRGLANAPCDVPIVLAASGPKMLALAGEAADGVLISGAVSVPFLRWCLDQVGDGANGGAVTNYGLVYTKIADPGGEATRMLRRTLGFILRGGHHARNLSLAGVELDQSALRTAYAAEDWDAVDRLIGADVVGAHAACGDAETVRARLDDYRAAGLDEIVLAGLTEPEEIETHAHPAQLRRGTTSSANTCI